MTTIHEAGAAMRAGTLTPLDLLDECLRRIDLYEPHVRAWVVIDRDGARAQAERLTDELRHGHDRGPLHGIPVGIKDIIDVFDLPTGCGSTLWANSYARQDAECVRRLRQAGAVILGKTVTTAFAFLDPPVTRNPWNLGRTPGGSSSGSAAAVACGMCLGALGTQTGGSITRPAAFCGVCSLKATHGRVSTAGVLPLAPSLDHVGVMAGCVTDLALLLHATADVDLLGEQHRNPVRLGWLRGPFEERTDPEVRNHTERFVRTLREGCDAKVIDVQLPAEFADVWPNHRAIMAAEAAQYHGARRRRYPADYPRKIAELVDEGLRMSARDLAAAYDHRETLMTRLMPVFRDVDVLVTPAAPGVAPGSETTGDAVFNSPWSYLGWPTVSFPVGAVSPENLPVAVQLIGPTSDEGALVAVARWCETQVGWNPGWPPVPGESCNSP